MDTLRIGLFSQFKGKDSVLLEGTQEAIRLLISRLHEFGKSQAFELPVHAESKVSVRNPVELFVVRFVVREPRPLAVGVGQRWLCSAEELPSIIDKLDSLVMCGSGHQYFALESTTVQLIVSVGEYGESWWQRHG